MPAQDPLARFAPPVAAWFRDAFAAPTRAQVDGWAAIAGGGHVLLHAPTGSGKTLAAFLWGLDRLVRSPAPPRTVAAGGSVRILYISPLKALTYDVERNLRAPLAGIALAGRRLGTPVRPISIASRTGDTPSDERRALAKSPPEILITTPESLYLLLTSGARETLRGVEHVIVDEVHAIAGTKRGAHLALSLERLEHLRGPGAPPLQRIGLSATQRPLETIGRFLAGAGADRGVAIVDAGTKKRLDLQVVVPIEDMSRLGEALPLDEQPGGPVTAGERRVSIWPAIHPRILELIKSHRSTLVFVNSRRLAERLAQRLNELAGEDLVRAHHGSIAREQRVAIEEALKEGRLPALVATSSLELGIDMGAIDLVIQVESPTSVARGLQRIGRAGHQVDEVSSGVIFPKYRGDLLECAVVAERMREGQIEATSIPRTPLDVLAQQIVAMSVMDRWTVADLHASVTRAAPFETLTREALDGVLAMLSGAYPSDEFAELKPRLVWDRVTDTIEGRRDARVVAVTSGGTIPDRGLYGVFVAGDAGTPGRRVGELDEEMVYELRAGMHGDVIVLGASSWRIAEITPDRVIVEPAPGQPGKLPFWKGDAVGRPIELGRALGAFTRAVEGDLARGAKGRATALARLGERHHLDALAAENLVAYLEDEREAAGALPTDRRIVVERFRDELGDWRLVLLSPFGGRVHAPWAMAIEARLRERLGAEVSSIWSDDGIAIRLPDGDLDGVEDDLFPDADGVEDLVVAAVGGTALFAARFRENAARALLLPRRRPGTRTPLWQQRQRAADLLAVASRYGSFPILVETYRECLADVFDLPALRDVLRGVERREIGVHRVETPRATPFASSLLFDYVAAYMYEGDAPLAERRAQALALDRDLLRELLGQEELRELLDPAALEETELERQALLDERKAGSVDQVADLLRRIGDLVGGGGGRPDARRAAGRPGVAGDAGRDAPRRRHPAGRRGPLDRGGGRRPLPGRHRRPAAARHAGRLPRRDPRRPGRAAGPLGPDPRAVPGRRAGAPVGPAAGDRGGRAGPAGGGGIAPAGRVPTRRRRARVVRPGRPAAPAPALARPASPRGRAGGARRAGALPAGLAGRGAITAARHRGRRGRCGLRGCRRPVADARHGGRRRSAGAARPGRPGAPRRGRGPAGRRPDPGVGPGARRPPGPGAGVPAPPARRAGRPRRGGMDRMRAAGTGRRPGGALPPRARRRPPGGARRRAGSGRSAAGRTAPRGHPGMAGAARGVLLSRALRRRRRRVGSRGAGRAVGPGLGRGGHERHVRPAARAALEAARGGSPAAARTPGHAGAAGGGGPLVAGGRRRGDGSPHARGARGTRHARGAGRPGRPARPAPRSDSTRWPWRSSTGTAC